MDPLTILALAAATVQFVDFGARLLSSSTKTTETTDSEEDGVGAGSSKIASLESISHDVASLARQIKERMLPVREMRGSQLSVSQANLLELCDRCQKIGEQVLAAVSEMQGRPDIPFKTFRMALQEVLKRDKIRKMELALRDIKSSLTTALIADLWAQSTTPAQRNQPTRHEVLINQLGQDQEGGNGACTAAALFNYTHGPHVPEDAQFDVGDAGGTRDAGDAACMTALLRSLEFVAQADREEAIPVAYARTYEWIFDQGPSRQHDEQDMWSAFPEWLMRDCDNVYWIMGKPGSGKSTIMKFLVRDPRTVSYLRKWASPRPLLVASFYSWNAGVDLQKSREGLLQALLYQILEQAPELAPRLLPARWALMKLFGTAVAQQFPVWTWREVFESVASLDSLSSDTRFNLAIFIDGLDEFTGDFSELIQLVKKFHSCRSIKVCVSSRPWNDFRDAFADCPQLRMELLTSTDMKCFVHGRFDSTRAFLELQAVSPVRACELREAIVEKASGVFLWASVVTNDLLTGLTEGDSLADLEATLEKLPADLEELYKTLWHGIRPKYKIESAQILAIFRSFKSSQRCLFGQVLPEWLMTTGIPLYILWFADGGAAEDASYITQTLTRRLASRTRGLLEIRPSGDVDCLHRTAHDWFNSMWTEIEQPPTKDFDANLAVLTGIITDIEYDPERYLRGETYSPWLAVLILCLSFASKVVDNVSSRKRLVTALDKMARLSFEEYQRDTHISWPLWSKIGPRPAITGFIKVAAELGLTPYVEVKVKEDSSLLSLSGAGTRDDLVSRLVLGPSGDRGLYDVGMKYNRAMPDLQIRLHEYITHEINFNAVGRYYLAHDLVSMSSIACNDPARMAKLLSGLRKDMTHEFYDKSRYDNYIRAKFSIPVAIGESEDEELPYGLAVLRMLEKHGAKGPLGFRLKNITRTLFGS